MYDESPNREDRLIATLAYPFWYLVFPMVYLTPQRGHSRFVIYHTYHAFFLGLGLWLGGITIYTAAAIIGKIIGIFSVLLYLFLPILKWGALGVTAYCMLCAWNGQTQYLPYITPFAQPYIDELTPPPPKLTSADQSASSTSTGSPNGV